MGSVQDARRAALRRQADQREQRLHQQRRLDTAAVEIAVALAERDAAIAAAEQRAGQALHAMVTEGLTLREATDWCGDQLTHRDATRLHRLATSDPAIHSPIHNPVHNSNSETRSPIGNSLHTGDGPAASVSVTVVETALAPDVEVVER